MCICTQLLEIHAFPTVATQTGHKIAPSPYPVM